MTARALLALVLLAFAGGCDDSGQTAFQGYMEAQLLLVGAEEGGRLLTVGVEEGSAVAAGAPLFALDPALQRAAEQEAAARAAEARAKLANLLAQQQRPEEIEILAARRRQADAAQDLAEQELRRQRELFQRGVTAKSRLDQAEASARESRAALQEVERQIQAGRLTARVQEIAGASAAAEAAGAALDQAREKLTRRNVAAPAAGTVQEVLYRPGEVVGAAQPVVALLPPERLRARFFVPEPLLPRFHIGDAVDVRCDGCPAGLRARISFISTEAEFTPPVIFGPSERAKLVFMVEAIPDGETRSLRPGQPVTVTPLTAPPPGGSGRS